MRFKVGFHPHVRGETVEVYDEEGNFLAAILPTSTGGLRIISELVCKDPKVQRGPISGAAIEAAAQAVGLDTMQVLELKRAGSKPWPASIDIEFDYAGLKRISS